MNAFVETLYRDVTCFVASAMLTAVFAAGFVQSTAVPYAARHHATVSVTHAAPPSWFGQPKPAVLVD